LSGTSHYRCCRRLYAVLPAAGNVHRDRKLQGPFRGHPGEARGRRASWPVGRVLCARFRGPAVIHLGLPLPAVSCGLPAGSGGPPSNVRAGLAPPGPLDLAPGGVYRAAAVTCGAGGLLHHRFTLTAVPGTLPRNGGGLFSVALSRGSPRVGVTDHPALRSPDLPRDPGCGAARPPGQLARRLINDSKPTSHGALPLINVTSMSREQHQLHIDAPARWRQDIRADGRIPRRRPCR
jgi:hypothetical protein